jgi:hypothetical protein
MATLGAASTDLEIEVAELRQRFAEREAELAEALKRLKGLMQAVAVYNVAGE